jgi:xanthine dehydrogenase accessory factor
MSGLILIRGAGDLASGVAIRLHRSGFRVMMTELAHPLVVRRMVSFAEAIYRGEFAVEGVLARRAEELPDVQDILIDENIPILVDPLGTVVDIIKESIPNTTNLVLIDARMLKQKPERGLDQADLVIGLGPGFTAGEDCHAIVETQRGHFLGRVIWEGSAQANTGVPEGVMNYYSDRVLRAPADGVLYGLAEIGEHILPGQIVAEVNSQPVKAPFRGALRGMLHSGLNVTQGMKIGDLDPRDEPRYCWLVSDKSLAVGGGVLEAILAHRNLHYSGLES